MREKIYVTDVRNIASNVLGLLVEEKTPLTELEAVGQMLVDSDELSFTYLLEKNDEYTYLMIGESIWPALHNAIKDNVKVVITNGIDQLELISFADELDYLVENIKGNSNYGESMVEKVEAVFQ